MSEPKDESSRRRVLIADDLDDAAISLGMFFESHDCGVRVCRSGGEVLETALDFRPHLILLDLDFGELPSGYDVARQLRNEPLLQGVVLAAVTGWTRASDRVAAEAAGFDHFFVKPADPIKVVDLVLAIDRRRGQSCSAIRGVDRRREGAAVATATTEGSAVSRN
jgi:DNA-binding response OmpR family regulator